MNETDFTQILSYSEKMLKEKSVQNLRPRSVELLDSIMDKKLIIGIRGLRGVGKSSLLIEALKKCEKQLYLSGDFLAKYGYNLYEALAYAYDQGFTSIGIDEIQVLENWPADLKLFYDESRAKIIITGSSAIEIGVRSSDLARRIHIEELKPFSFREYLFFKASAILKKRTLDELMENKMELSKELAPFINLYPDFVGSYGLPAAFFEGKEVYAGVIERIVYRDLLPLKSINIAYIDSSFKVLKFLASSKPGEFSYSSVAKSLGHSTKFTIELVRLLSISGILTIVPPDGAGHKSIRGEDKILLPLSFRTALGAYFGVKVETGALREDFFIHHVSKPSYFRESGKRIPDYRIGDQIFEIGGEGKTHSQIKGLKNSYLVKESLSIKGNEIPLYLFGLLY